MKSKQAMCNALRAFINQRSGIDRCNYGASREAFMSDYRPIIRHGQHARRLLSFVERSDSITAEMLESASRAFSGRLQFVERGDKVGVDYTTGQYFPTEYHSAACAVLAQSIWDWLREKCECKTVDDIRAAARREFGRGIASVWFN